MGKIHSAKVEKSPRLQKTLALLRQRGNVGATSREIAIEVDTVCPATCISELRDNGYAIQSKQEGKRWRYTLRQDGQNGLF